MKIIKFCALTIFGIIIIVFLYSSIGGLEDPYDKVKNDPDILKFKTRYINCDYINASIQHQYFEKKKYPMNTTEIGLIIAQKFLIDPITKKSDWEVCDSKNPDIWYRTTIESYDSILSLWNPSEHEGIFKVRPRKVPEEEKIKQHLNDLMGNSNEKTYIEDTPKFISLKTPQGGMDTRQILEKIKKQADKKFKIGRFSDLTIEIEIQNLPLEQALEKVVAVYNLTAKKLYKNIEIMFAISIDENCYIVTYDPNYVAH